MFVSRYLNFLRGLILKVLTSSSNSAVRWCPCDGGSLLGDWKSADSEELAIWSQLFRVPFSCRHQPLPSPILISKEKWAYWSLKSGKARPDDSGRLTVKMSNFLVSSLFCREGTISIAKLSWRQYCCCCKYFFIKRLLWPIPLLHGTERFRRWEVRFPSSQLIMSTTSKTRVNQTGTASLSQDIPQTLSLGEAW